ncbi:response regulator transcription factor [Cognatilysobacter lacus]|uniref:Response regulator n=1 Tax=Cognatilysobacter lacus TaxID=1643323 RepID=A0A5D8ZBV3_9GAMM|nr:response regulator [Lysobacter lacus]TZF91533.1 response regulator [Lysobacter lacus]
METRILVVDDNARVRELLADMLELDGHVVYQAETGQVALQLMQGGLNPRLVVCDLMMPDVDGWQVLASVEQMAERPNVIIFTSLGDLASIERLTERYGCTVMKKPEQLREVVAAARALLNRPN